MHTQVYRKVLLHLSIIGIIVSILAAFYDVIFHFVMEALHIVFEMVESMLDKMVEHSFETELHETQLIVFYMLLFIGVILGFLLWKLLKAGFSHTRSSVGNEWADFKNSVVSDWAMLSGVEKVLGIVVFIFLNWLISFFFF
jgi:hypothetical protein